MSGTYTLQLSYILQKKIQGALWVRAKGMMFKLVQLALAHTSVRSLQNNLCLDLVLVNLKKGPMGLKTSMGVEHLTTSMLISCASDGFKDKIPLYDRPLAPEDLMEAARITCAEIGINQYVWNEAVQVMGAVSAAISVIVTDVNQQHPEKPVLNPGGFFRGMISAAKAGELQLHKSIFGIMVREASYEVDASPRGHYNIYYRSDFCKIG